MRAENPPELTGVHTTAPSRGRCGRSEPGGRAGRRRGGLRCGAPGRTRPDAHQPRLVVGTPALISKSLHRRVRLPHRRDGKRTASPARQPAERRPAL